MIKVIKEIFHYAVLVILLIYIVEKLIKWIALKFPLYFNTTLKSFLISLTIYVVVFYVADKLLHRWLRL